MRDYKNIRAYQLADELVMSIYRATKTFPKEEMYGLTSQLRRAAVSVPANIVEGASRKNKGEYIQFLYIARGSLAETEYLLSLANGLEYLSKNLFDEIDNARKDVAKTLYGLISAVENGS